MPFLPLQRRFEAVEEFPGPQRPFQALVGALVSGMLTETGQNVQNSNSASPTFAYAPSPQSYGMAASFNAVIPVKGPVPATLPARSRHNSIEDL